MAAKVEHIQEVEHFGDEMTHAIFTKLNQTFITPFDREDIHTLTSSLDDVLDFINGAGDPPDPYKITQPRRTPRNWPRSLSSRPRPWARQSLCWKRRSS